MTNYDWLVTKGKDTEFLSNIYYHTTNWVFKKYNISDNINEDTAIGIKEITTWLQKEHREPLKPCPFCGGDAEIINTQPYVYYVRCKICKGCSNEFGVPNVAIEKWNRRVEK